MLYALFTPALGLLLSANAAAQLTELRDLIFDMGLLCTVAHKTNILYVL